MTDRRKTAVCVILLTVFVVALFADVLFLGRGLFLSDVSRYFYPLKQVVRTTILGGEFPWWNRLYSGGQPMAANPAYEVFYPGQWPILIGSPRFGYNLHIILHVWLALVATFLFLREDGRSYTASAVGALSFATGGFFFSMPSALSAAFVWAWMPVAGFFLWRWRARGELRWLGGAAFALGMQMLIGEPVAVMQTWVLIGVCAVADALRNRERVKGNAAALVFIVVLSAGVGAAQLIPGVDHLRDTSRSAGLSYANATQFSTMPERAAELIWPHSFGSHANAGQHYWAAKRSDGAPYFLSIYLGLIVAVFAVASLLATPRVAVPVFAVCGMAYLAALGFHTPFFGALYDAGIASRFRYPEKFLSLIVLPLIWVAMRMFDRFVEGDVRAARVVSLLVAALTAAVAIWSVTPSYVTWFTRYWNAPDAFAMISRHYWFIAVAFTVTFAALLWSSRRWSAPVWSAAMVVFCIADLSQIRNELAPRMPRRFFDPPGIVNALDRPIDGYAIFHLGDWLRENARFVRAGYGHYWMARNGLVPPTDASWGIRTAMDRDYDETYLRPTRDMIDAMLSLNFQRVQAWWQPFAAISNVRYVLDYRDYDQIARECGGRFEFSRPVTLRRFRAFTPRYFFAREIIQARSPADVATILRARGVIPGAAFVPFAAFAPAEAHVLRVTETSSGARIDVAAAAPSLLVMTVTRHRYWRLAIDGKPVDAQPANIAYQCVAVPAGMHVVTMRYRNPLVIAGIVISVAALAVIIAIMTFGDRWKIAKTR